MKILLLFFSGTGATGKFAFDIADQLKQMGHEVHITRMKRDTILDVKDYQLVGFGAPTYSFRAPRLVTSIIKKGKLGNIPYFVFCTSGCMPGNTLWNLYNVARKPKNHCLDSISAAGVTNLRSWMPSTDQFSKQNNSAIHDLWYPNRNYIANFCTKILHRYTLVEDNFHKAGHWAPRLNLWTSIWSLFFTWRWEMQITVGRKQIDHNLCSKCGLCASIICPNNAISWQILKFPSFNESKCIGCNGCVNICPENAINSKITKKHIQYKIYQSYILGF